MNALDPIAWSILLMMIGSALVVLEVFIPSGGVLGILAGAAYIGSIVFAFQRGMASGFVFTTVAVIVAPMMLALAVKILPRTPMGKVLIGDLPTEEEVAPHDSRRALVGRVAVAQSKMLPSGSIEIDGQYIDAVSQGQAIEPGQHVTIVEVGANRVVVRPVREGERLEVPNEDPLSRPIEDFGIESLDDPLA